ncbi:extracellular solute-binding protein [Paenibacillus sp. GCM10012306]|uniref:extracellular solute-binding protein n=1 Tax=Paenibacillus sp. GCM10012306 TaxID=3317342 RepID=UPI003621056A
MKFNMNTINKKRKSIRRVSLGLCAALLLPLASSSLHTAWAEPGKDQVQQKERVLRIGSLWSGEDDTYFRQQFTDLYEMKHPEVKLEIVPAIDSADLRFTPGSQAGAEGNLESFRKLMGGDKPVDVIVGDSKLIKSLRDHNMLKPLQPLIDRDHYDISNMAPTMLDGIRELGDGNLFALAPTFNSSALYYNKAIFDKAGLPYPTNGMTWDEVFTLAAKVVNASKMTKVSGHPDSGIYGFSMSRYSSDPFWDMLSYISPLQLTMYDNKGEKMTVNNQQWKKAWTTYSELVHKGIIPGLGSTQSVGNPESNGFNPLEGELFATGKAAMVIGEYGYLKELADIERNAAQIPNYKLVNWGIVSVPSFAEKPGVSSGTWLGNMMAISANASNQEDAWDLIKFVNSNEVAKIKAHNSYELTSRKDYITSSQPGLDLQAFYTQKPLPAGDPAMDQLEAQKPGITQISDAGRQLFIEVYNGRQSVDRALKTWESQGNKMLEKLRKSPSSTFDLEDGWITQGAVRN